LSVFFFVCSIFVCFILIFKTQNNSQNQSSGTKKEEERLMNECEEDEQEKKKEERKWTSCQTAVSAAMTEVDESSATGSGDTTLIDEHDEEAE
jgi:hypothetical protein